LTTAASGLEQVLRQRFDGLVFQRVNCRRIAGTSLWSQHSWPGGNARDIFGPDLAPSPASQALLDRVAAYLRANRVRFGIKVILWRVPNHLNHVHADMWPTGHLQPPCAGGEERYRYSNGRIVYAHLGRVAPEGIFESPPMSFTPAEEHWLKLLASRAEYLYAHAENMASLDAQPASVGHILQTYRRIADKLGVSGADHETIASRLLGQ
jgi:hypothetical protein